ncbi:hypothetical protein P3T20_001203 [Paraburkholderia sp. GAS206C]|jgi:hypothetical protein
MLVRTPAFSRLYRRLPVPGCRCVLHALALGRAVRKGTMARATRLCGRPQSRPGTGEKVGMKKDPGKSPGAGTGHEGIVTASGSIPGTH